MKAYRKLCIRRHCTWPDQHWVVFLRRVMGQNVNFKDCKIFFEACPLMFSSSICVDQLYKGQRHFESTLGFNALCADIVRPEYSK